jgi:hypothetical protein
MVAIHPSIPTKFLALQYSGVEFDTKPCSAGSVFWDFCQDNLIDVYYSSVAHPRCNGQVERANEMVLQALKDCIYDDASNYTTRWLAELPHIIWGLRT